MLHGMRSQAEADASLLRKAAEDSPVDLGDAPQPKAGAKAPEPKSPPPKATAVATEGPAPTVKAEPPTAEQSATKQRRDEIASAALAAAKGEAQRVTFGGAGPSAGAKALAAKREG